MAEKAYKACTRSLSLMSLYSLRKMILRDPQVAKLGKCQVNTKGVWLLNVVHRQEHCKTGFRHYVAKSLPQTAY